MEIRFLIPSAQLVSSTIPAYMKRPYVMMSGGVGISDAVVTMRSTGYGINPHGTPIFLGSTAGPDGSFSGLVEAKVVYTPDNFDVLPTSISVSTASRSVDTAIRITDTHDYMIDPAFEIRGVGLYNDTVGVIETQFVSLTENAGGNTSYLDVVLQSNTIPTGSYKICLLRNGTLSPLYTSTAFTVTT